MYRESDWLVQDYLVKSHLETLRREALMARLLPKNSLRRQAALLLRRLAQILEAETTPLPSDTFWRAA